MAKPIKFLSHDDICDIQMLYQIGISKAAIAKHFNVTPPTITYYTKGQPILPTGILLELLDNCDFNLDKVRAQQQA